MTSTAWRSDPPGNSVGIGTTMPVLEENSDGHYNHNNMDSIQGWSVR